MAKKRQINTAVHNLVNDWNYIQWDKFEPVPLAFSQKNKRGDFYCDEFITLDTETSWNHDMENPKGWVYQWAFTYLNNVVYGRRPSELVEALQKVAKVNGLGAVALTQSGVITKKLVVYVHNLSYDYCYIADWLREVFGGIYQSGENKENMLAIAPHSIISHSFDGFDFKCSFKLTHKSLAQWGKDVNSLHKKLVGAIDYNEIHYQDEPLYKNDWKYMFYDVIVLNECVRLQMKMYNDDVISIPLTVTGYVRREVRNEYMKEKRNRYQFTDRKLTADLYKMCRAEFAGGLTHGNRMRAGETVRPPQGWTIKHRDFRSHYPSQQRAYNFPVGKPRIYYDKELSKIDSKPPTISTLLQKFGNAKCMLVELELNYAELKDYHISIPYLQYDKCMKGGFIKDCDEDNGRILRFSGMVKLVMNEDDLLIMSMQYKIRYAITRVVIMNKGKLPKYLIDSIDRFFKNKTDYKDQVKALQALAVSDSDPRMVEACINLMIAKGMLNGIYGMTATELIRAMHLEAYFDELDDDGNIIRNKGQWYKDEPETDEEKQEALDNYYKQYTNFMDYQFGCWTTSHARLELIRFCVLIGWDNVLYCDTDSIFYLSNDEIEQRVEAKNKELLERSEKVGAYIISDKGKKVHYDQFELEKEEIVSFRFLHAKCYAYEKIKKNKEGATVYDENGNALTELVAVIAGVKKIGATPSGKKITREKELGSIENLNTGYVFEDCGGTVKAYVSELPHIEEINGHRTEIASSCILMKSSKTLHSMDEIIVNWGMQEDIYQYVDCEE